MAKLLTDLRVGESLPLDGGRITITLEEKRGRVARLKIESPLRLNLSLGEKAPPMKLPQPPRAKSVV